MTIKAIILATLLAVLFSLTEQKHKCGHNKIDRSKRYANPSLQARGRKLGEEKVKKEPLRVTFDTSSLDSLAPQYSVLKTEILAHLQLSAQLFSEMLLVERLTENNYFPEWGRQDKCMETYPPEKDIKEGVANSDLHIYVSHYHDPKDGYLAFADSCHWTSYNRPIFGGITFNTGGFLASGKYRNDYFEDNFETVVHEIMHVVGFSNGMYEYFINPATGKAYGKDNNPLIFKTIRGQKTGILTTPKVTKLAREHFGCPTLEGIQMENEGGDASAGAHFERVVLENEFMTAGAIAHDAQLTDFTMAVLEDSGFYESTGIKLDTIDWGKGQGCNFLTECTAGKYREFDSSAAQCSFYHSGVGRAAPELDYYNDNCNITAIYYDSLCFDTNNIRPLDPVKGNVYGINNRCFYSNIIDIEQGPTTDLQRCLPWVCNEDGSQVYIIVGGEKYAINKATNKADIKIQGQNTRLEGYVNGPADWQGFCNTYPLQCPNFCSAHGYCLGRQCHCGVGYAGSDCSIQCGGNNYLHNGTCLNSQVCPDGTTANKYTKECIKNPDPAPCSEGQFKHAGQCVSSCPDHFFKEGNSCQACNYYCQTCSGYQFCDTCREGFYLFQANGKKECITKCLKGTTLDQKKNECIDNNLLPCPNQNEFRLQGKCVTQCPSKLFRLNNSCVNQCPEKYYSAAQLCQKCDDSCKTCSSGNACDTCELGLYQHTVQSNKQCLSKCPENFYGSSNFQCIDQSICDKSCQSCENSSSCVSCKPDFYSHNSQCLTKCPVGFGNNQQKQCQVCSNNDICEECSDVNTCTKCKSGHFLDSSKGTCVKCSNLCKECTSSTKCLSCEVESVKVENAEDGTAKCVKNCKEGEFLDEKSATCEKCPKNCLSCKNANSCTNCGQQSFLDKEKCVECNQLCKTCSPDNSCLTCEDQAFEFYIQKQLVCVDKCPAEHKLEGSKCVKSFSGILNFAYILVLTIIVILI